MITRRVVLSPEARDDLLAIYDWLAGIASADVALDYVERVERFVMKLDIGSQRGTERDDVRPGLRVIGFERKLAVAFTVEQDRVVILRIFRGGRDWRAVMGD